MFITRPKAAVFPHVTGSVRFGSGAPAGISSSSSSRPPGGSARAMRWTGRAAALLRVCEGLAAGGGGLRFFGAWGMCEWGVCCWTGHALLTNLARRLCDIMKM
jgi:hypothetical protein